MEHAMRSRWMLGKTLAVACLQPAFIRNRSQKRLVPSATSRRSASQFVEQCSAINEPCFGYRGGVQYTMQLGIRLPDSIQGSTELIRLSSPLQYFCGNELP